MGHAGSALSDGTKLLNVTGGGVVTTSSSTVGSLTKPVFLNAGTLTETTYSLNATINSGTANRMAYYSGANTISAVDHYVSSTQVAIASTAQPDSSFTLFVNGKTNSADTISVGTQTLNTDGTA